MTTPTDHDAGVCSAHAARGQHLLLTLAGCPPPLLDDLAALERLVCLAAQATGASVLQVISHRFSPYGVTALALLAESHASLHTYPERGVAFWDCFTCGPACDPQRSVAGRVAALRPQATDQQAIVRAGDV